MKQASIPATPDTSPGSTNNGAWLEWLIFQAGAGHALTIENVPNHLGHHWCSDLKEGFAIVVCVALNVGRDAGTDTDSELPVKAVDIPIRPISDRKTRIIVIEAEEVARYSKCHGHFSQLKRHQAVYLLFFDYSVNNVDTIQADGDDTWRELARNLLCE